MLCVSNSPIASCEPVGVVISCSHMIFLNGLIKELKIKTLILGVAKSTCLQRTDSLTYSERDV